VCCILICSCTSDTYASLRCLFASCSGHVFRCAQCFGLCEKCSLNNPDINKTEIYVQLLTLTSWSRVNSWEANRVAASQEIPHILCNPKVHYRIHNCPPPVPVLSQFDPVHTPTSHCLKINFNIIVPFTRGSLKWSLSLRFLHQNTVYASPLPRPSHYSRFYHPHIIEWLGNMCQNFSMFNIIKKIKFSLPTP